MYVLSLFFKLLTLVDEYRISKEKQFQTLGQKY